MICAGDHTPERRFTNVCYKGPQGGALAPTLLDRAVQVIIQNIVPYIYLFHFATLAYIIYNQITLIYLPHMFSLNNSLKIFLRQIIVS